MLKMKMHERREWIRSVSPLLRRKTIITIRVVVYLKLKLQFLQ